MMQVRRDDANVLKNRINKKTIYRYLKMSPDEKWELIVDEVLCDLFEMIQLRAQILMSEIAQMPSGVRLLEIDYNIPSLDLKAHLEGEEKVYIVFCSLGEKVSQKIRQEMMLNPSHGVVYDACASEIAESYADFINKSIAEESIRFSPGYGDLLLLNQYEIAKIMQTDKHMGLHVKSTGFMHPEKSICFILGRDGHAVRRMNKCSDCRSCTKRTCLYRRNDEKGYI